MLAVALDSLLAQTRPIDEIIVVDDATTDDTQDVLAAYHERVRVIRLLENHGKPAALNLAIPQARGFYVWLFDDDDAALPDALEKHLDYFDRHPDIEFSYSDKYVFSGSGDIWERSVWRIDRMPVLAPENFLLKTMLSMNTLLQGMLVPKTCLQSVGLFDEALQRCEDHDIIMRLAARFRGGNIGCPTFVYREHAGVRGAGVHSHAARDRYKIMADYRRGIFRDVREHFALACYLPDVPNDRGVEPESDTECRALVQRGCIMLRHGLVDEALADLDRALASPAVELLDQAWVAETLSQSMDVEPSVFIDKRSLFTRLCAVLNRHHQASQGRYFMRGIYWNLRRALSNRDLVQAAGTSRMLFLFALILGLRLKRSRAA